MVDYWSTWVFFGVLRKNNTQISQGLEPGDLPDLGPFHYQQQEI